MHGADLRMKHNLLKWCWRVFLGQYCSNSKLKGGGMHEHISYVLYMVKHYHFDVMFNHVGKRQTDCTAFELHVFRIKGSS